MPTTPLNIFFPQWQGAGAPSGLALHQAAHALLERLPNRADFHALDIPTQSELGREHGIIGYADLRPQYEALSALLATQQPDQLLLLGGDCAAEIAPIAYLNQRYEGNLGVLWLDGHADLNSAATSPSGTFHGMPVRVLLGDGDPAFTPAVPLQPHQIVFAGVRDLDPPEADYITAHNIPLFGVNALNEALTPLLEALATFDTLYIHVDVDVLDPRSFPPVYYPAEHGLIPRQLEILLAAVAERGQVVGASLLEFTPPTASQWETLESLWGQVAATLRP